MNRFYTYAYKKPRSRTFQYMEKLSKDIGKTIFIKKHWEHWWPEAVTRYGFKYEVACELKNGYAITIISQDRPSWMNKR